MVELELLLQLYASAHQWCSSFISMYAQTHLIHVVKAAAECVLCVYMYMYTNKANSDQT